MRATIWHWTKRIWRVLGRLALAVTFFAAVLAQDASPAFAQQPAPNFVKLERGQELELFLSTRVDSESSQVGNVIEFQLREPVMRRSQTVLPAGWPVTAHVSIVQHAGKTNCKRGAVDWKLDALQAPDGTKVQLVSLRGRVYERSAPDKVRLPAAGHKFEKVVAAPFIALAFVPFLPMGIAMWFGHSDVQTPCASQPGAADTVPAWTTQYAAVARDAKIKVSSGSTAN